MGQHSTSNLLLIKDMVLLKILVVFVSWVAVAVALQLICKEQRITSNLLRTKETSELTLIADFVEKITKGLRLIRTQQHITSSLLQIKDGQWLKTTMNGVFRREMVFRLICKEQDIISNLRQIKDLLRLNSMTHVI
jgi:hypothetical protein